MVFAASRSSSLAVRNYYVVGATPSARSRRVSVVQTARAAVVDGALQPARPVSGWGECVCVVLRQGHKSFAPVGPSRELVE